MAERQRKRRRKLTTAQETPRSKRRKKYMTIFIDGKQKRVPRPTQVGGMEVGEFIRQDADAIWLHQNEMWECMNCDDEDSEDDGSC